MLTNTLIDMPLKPRVLIADDSRIVRATLIKHIEGMFEFREALDGEQAWETLLIDPNIRVLITDLTMPKLDGYGLLQRIRASKISRIRNMPVVVVSGSDAQEERARAKAAGATDLITKGIGTAQLLSRLDVLAKLVNTQREFERGLESLVHNTQTDNTVELSSPEVLESQAEVMLANAVKNSKNFVILNVCVTVKHSEMEGSATSPPVVVNAVGQLLQRTVRQGDCVAKTGDAEFTLATGNIHFDSARNFAQRVCRAIASADLIKDDKISVVASCGLVSLSEYGADPSVATLTLEQLCGIACRRAILGLNHGLSGVVGAEEEAAFKANPDSAIESFANMQRQVRPAEASGTPAPDLATLLQWIKEGKQDQVLKHMGNLSAELQPLVDLMLQKSKT